MLFLICDASVLLVFDVPYRFLLIFYVSQFQYLCSIRINLIIYIAIEFFYRKNYFTNILHNKLFYLLHPQSKMNKDLF